MRSVAVTDSVAGSEYDQRSRQGVGLLAEGRCGIVRRGSGGSLLSGSGTSVAEGARVEAAGRREAASWGGRAEATALRERLRRVRRSPQVLFAEALQDYAEEEKEVWAKHFGPDFCERIAPKFLGEIYASGTAKQWAKDWIREKSLGNCNEAREIIPTCATIDSFFLTDQVRGAINMASIENLARKVLGIKLAFAAVDKEADWKRPKNVTDWKSAIDVEVRRRTDPHFDDKQLISESGKADEATQKERDEVGSMLIVGVTTPPGSVP